MTIVTPPDENCWRESLRASQNTSRESRTVLYSGR